MKVKYFGDTDTLYIEFREADVTETRDLDENTLIDLDREGQLCAITVEHASIRADIPHFSFEQIPAQQMAKS
ncbi:MAG: DUF2283 domain-containing protein [Nitrospirae bacterium]|jgi:uncharacterized protein YuzE|nr:DUF2283 domain-containing protein [Nitrospirota bacterium]